MNTRRATTKADQFFFPFYFFFEQKKMKEEKRKRIQKMYMYVLKTLVNWRKIKNSLKKCLLLACSLASSHTHTVCLSICLQAILWTWALRAISREKNTTNVQIK